MKDQSYVSMPKKKVGFKRLREGPFKIYTVLFCLRQVIRWHTNLHICVPCGEPNWTGSCIKTIRRTNFLLCPQGQLANLGDTLDYQSHTTLSTKNKRMARKLIWNRFIIALHLQILKTSCDNTYNINIIRQL